MDRFYIQAILIALIIFSICVYAVITYRSESIFIRPTIEKVSFFRDYLFLTLMPYIYYVNNDNYQQHYILNNLDSNAYFVYAGINSCLFMLIFLLAYKIFYKPIARSFSKMQGTISVGSYKNWLVVLLVLFTIYFVYISLRFKAGVWGLFNSSMSEINESRHMLSSGGGILSFNKILVQSWIPILSYTIFYMHLTHHKERLLTIFSFVLGALAAVFFFEKSTLFFFLLGYIAVYLYAGRKISLTIIFSAFITAIIVVSFMYIITYGDRISGSDYLLDIIIHRTATQSVGSVMALNYFENHDYFYLSGISNMLASLTGEKFRSVYSALIAYYDPENADISGSLSSFAAGEAYGLFGYPGIIFGGVIVGIFYAFLEASKYAKNLSLLFVGFYGLYYSHFYIASSFYSFIWPIGMIYDIAPFLIIFIIAKIKSELTYNGIRV
ncbi:oligosaccharide repeat unit polymerase [Enterobacter sp. MW07]|nr:oligosaccharide repeat unit polymerase [Enterobacter sp. MW07]